MKSSITALTLFFISASAGAQIYECVDAKGRKEYAQSCPAGTVKETPFTRSGVNTAPSAPAAAGTSPAPAAKSLAEREAEFRKRNMERKDAEAKAAKSDADAKTSKYNCDIARAQLKQLVDGQRIARPDPVTGERVYVEDKDRPVEIANAQKSVDSWCSR